MICWISRGKLMGEQKENTGPQGGSTLTYSCFCHWLVSWSSSPASPASSPYSPVQTGFLLLREFGLFLSFSVLVSESK